MSRSHFSDDLQIVLFSLCASVSLWQKILTQLPCRLGQGNRVMFYAPQPRGCKVYRLR